VFFADREVYRSFGLSFGFPNSYHTVSPFPVDDALAELKTALASRPVVLLTAAPGSGKTTRVPLALLDEDWLAGETVLMLEPRRLAARGAAAYMAESLGEQAGDTVGYQVRLDKKIGPKTRVEIVTEGLLARRVQNSPELEGVGLVIFDEFHERHLQTDLALALCLDIQQNLRDDLRILIMSATLDAESLASKLDNAPIITAHGRSYPIEMHWGQRAEPRQMAEAAAQIIRHAFGEKSGDILAFFPGIGEIKRCADSLQGIDAEVLTLHGDVPKEQQDRALKLGQRRKVILASAIAESSLTIEGITIVVDSGWSRLPKFNPNTGFTQLETLRVSRASADQRAGRAGRLGPGHCYRLWSESEHLSLPGFHPPEITQADLAPLALELASWGVNDPNDLFWLDPPTGGSYKQATNLLTDLELLDKQRITPMGKRAAGLSVHPRLAASLLANRDGDDSVRRAAVAVATIAEERDPIFSATSADIDLRVGPLAAGQKNGPWRLLQALYLRHCKQQRVAPQGELGDSAKAVIAAWPDRVAISSKQQADGSLFQLSNGQQGWLPADDPLSGSEALAVAWLQPRKFGPPQIRLAASLTLRSLEEYCADRIISVETVDWDNRNQKLRAETQSRLGQLILSRKPLQNIPADKISQALCNAIRRTGLSCLPWEDESNALRDRLNFAQQQQPSAWPAVGGQALLDSLEEWLGPWLDGKRSLKALAQIPLKEALKSLLDYSKLQQLNQFAPERLQVPSGSNIRVDYGENPPVLAVKLQEMFGATETPSVANGSVKVLLHLLSPGKQPLAVTQDLPSFWKNGYPAVRKEVRGRYKRHPWPEDPTDAFATKLTKKRLGI
jgi:ATP-dependent helicase HrpB